MRIGHLRRLVARTRCQVIDRTGCHVGHRHHVGAHQDAGLGRGQQRTARRVWRDQRIADHHVGQVGCTGVGRGDGIGQSVLCAHIEGTVLIGIARRRLVDRQLRRRYQHVFSLCDRIGLITVSRAGVGDRRSQIARQHRVAGDQLTGFCRGYQRTAIAGAGQIVADRHVGQVRRAGVGRGNRVSKDVVHAHVTTAVHIFVVGQVLHHRLVRCRHRYFFGLFDRVGLVRVGRAGVHDDAAQVTGLHRVAGGQYTGITRCHQRTGVAGAGQVVTDRHVGQVRRAGVGRGNRVSKDVVHAHVTTAVHIFVVGQVLHHRLVRCRYRYGLIIARFRRFGAGCGRLVEDRACGHVGCRDLIRSDQGASFTRRQERTR